MDIRQSQTLNTGHTFWSRLIRCVNVKWIRLVLWKIQSGHGSVHRWTDGQGETGLPRFSFVEAGGYNNRTEMCKLKQGIIRGRYEKRLHVVASSYAYWWCKVQHSLSDRWATINRDIETRFWQTHIRFLHSAKRFLGISPTIGWRQRMYGNVTKSLKLSRISP